MRMRTACLLIVAAAVAAPFAVNVAGKYRIATLSGDLRSYDQTRRCSALRQLGEVGPPAIPHLVSALRGMFPAIHDGMDLDPSVVEARNALVAIGPSAVPALTEMLRDESPVARVHAALALARLSGHELSVTALSNGRNGDAQCVIYVLVTVISNEEDEHVLGHAAGALAEGGWDVGGQAATDFAVRVLAGRFPDPERSFHSIARQGGRAVPLLVCLLHGTSPELRWRSAEALGALGPAAVPAIRHLKYAAGDSDEALQTAARRAIEKLTTVTQPAGGRHSDGVCDAEK